MFLGHPPPATTLSPRRPISSVWARWVLATLLRRPRLRQACSGGVVCAGRGTAPGLIIRGSLSSVLPSAPPPPAPPRSSEIRGPRPRLSADASSLRSSARHLPPAGRRCQSSSTDLSPRPPLHPSRNFAQTLSTTAAPGPSPP